MTAPDPPVALDELLAHRAWVRSLALALARDEHEAADVEQATWIAAIESPPTRRTSLRGWLGTTARHALSRLRRSDRRRVAHEVAAAARDERDDASDASALAARADAHRRVVEALVALDEPYRRTLLLRYFEGLTVAEVAARTSVPLETCRARLRRGIAKLRTQLEGEFGGRAAFGVALGWLARGSDGSGAAAGTAAGVAAGGVAMAGAKTVAAVVAVLALLAGAVWWSRGDDRPDVARSGSGVAVGSGDVRAASRAGSGAPPAPAAAHRDRPRAAPPEESRAGTAAEEAAATPPVVRTAQEKLDQTKMGGKWAGTSLLSMLGEVAGTADVDVVVPEAQMESARKVEINLTMSAVSTAQILRVVCSVSGLTYTIRADQVIVHARGAEPAADAKLVSVERANFPPAVEQTLQFRVLRDDGAPAAGAVLVVPGVESVLAHVADDGTASFTMKPPFPAVVARLAGHVDSAEAAIDTRRGAEGVVEVRLRGAAGRLVGTVTCEGVPVAGATVRVEIDTTGDAADGKQRIADVVHVLTTDAEGRFLDAGAPPPRVAIWVRAAGCVADSRTLDVVAGAETRADFALAREAVIEGRITRDGGTPVKGATVSIRLSETPQGHPLAALRAPSFVATDADGAFVLRNVPGGRVRLSASIGDDGPVFEEWTDVAAGSHRRWDVAIDGGLRLKGRVVAPRGEMTAGWTVRSVRDLAEPITVASAPCDATGAFDLLCASPDVRRVAVYSHASTFPVKVVDPAAVAAAGGEITVEAHELPSAVVRIDVALASSDASIRWSLDIRCATTGDRRAVPLRKPGGELRSSRLPPGRYLVRLVPTTGDAIDLGEHDLAVGETKDLGTVTLPAPR